MGSCQNKGGIIIKANSPDIHEKHQRNLITSEKYELDTRFIDMPEWPSNKIKLN